LSNPLYDIPAGMLAVTPSNSQDINKAYTGIWLESGGDLSVMFRDGSTHIYSGLLKHSEKWGHFKRILVTGTTVTGGDIYMMKAGIGAGA